LQRRLVCGMMMQCKEQFSTQSHPFLIARFDVPAPRPLRQPAVIPAPPPAPYPEAEHRRPAAGARGLQRRLARKSTGGAQRQQDRGQRRERTAQHSARESHSQCLCGAVEVRKARSRKAGSEGRAEEHC